jgi:hypothetical protein
VRILGLDPSTEAAGYCLGDRDQVIRSGVAIPEGTGWAAVVAYGRWLAQVLPEMRPDVIGYEIPAGSHGNRHTDRILGGLQGISLHLADAAGIRVILLYPVQIKNTGCHKDALPVAEHYAGHLVRGLEGDHADAIGAWLAVLARLKQERWEVGQP